MTVVMNPSHKYTKQATFDKIVRHLRKQGVRCVNGDKNDLYAQCLYLNDEGHRCSVGCLIPKAAYTPDMEMKSFDILVDQMREIKDEYATDYLTEGHKKLYEIIKKQGHDFELLNDMQDIHDANLPSQWEKEFKLVANKHNLKYSGV